MFDGLYYRGKKREREQRAKGEPSCIVSHNNFIFTATRCLFSVILMNK